MKRYKLFLLFLLVSLAILTPDDMLSAKKISSEKACFSGEGTSVEPYLIETYHDLCTLRDLVNSGYQFENIFFRQTNNIDMRNDNWIPIGNDDNYFSGVYDGGGHYIENICIQLPSDDVNAKAGLFANLGGVVANLGIESGTINGTLCGSIAVSSWGEHAAIFNCYSKAELHGLRAGGIADSFSGGVIACSWSDTELYGDSAGGIVSLGGDVKLYSCFTTYPTIAPIDVVSTTSYALPKSRLFSEDFILKSNIKIGLCQYLFCEAYQIRLMQWELADSGLGYCSNTEWLIFWGFINSYFMPILTLLFIFYYGIRFFRIKGKIWDTYPRQVKTYAFIFGFTSLFLDTALISKGVNSLNIGNTIFILQINAIFIFCLIIMLRHIPFSYYASIKKHIPFIAVVILAVVLEFLQFNLIPNYDACLYYGSFVKGTQMFRLDLLSYIGSFVCWKWIQGLGIFLAPFEFLLPGQMTGMYIGNMLITVITLYFLYRLLQELYIGISPYISAVCCAIFLFLPYGLGMFTYLCMDCQLAFFAVWLLYGLKHKNNVFVAFCGYLLAFTKITGLVFYVFLLIGFALIEVASLKEGSYFEKIRHWWSWKTVGLWIFPAVCFLLAFFLGDYLTAQNFYGTYVAEDMVQMKSGIALANTLFQTFVWGFRWMIVIGFIITFVIRLLPGYTPKKIITTNGKKILYASLIAGAGTLLLLCLNNGDAECPRYTAIFNILYAIIIPYILISLFSDSLAQKVNATIIAAIFLVQTYWTIDPALICLTPSIDTGKKEIHKLALSPDDRPGMNLGVGYGLGIEVMGDVYTYNLEHAYYDNLLDQTFEKIAPTPDDSFYILDIIDYELHISGSYHRNYKIYWNSRLQKRTYDKWDENSMYLNVCSITTSNLCDTSEGELDLPQSFYLVVVSRVNSDNSIRRLRQEGYEIKNEYHPENIYGRLSVYELEKCK